MTRTIFTPSDQRRDRLSAVWIETGDTKRPLARVWIDRDLHILSCDGVHLQCA